MYGVELYSKVRIAVLRDGLSQREAARRPATPCCSVCQAAAWIVRLRLRL